MAVLAKGNAAGPIKIETVPDDHSVPNGADALRVPRGLPVVRRRAPADWLQPVCSCSSDCVCRREHSSAARDVLGLELVHARDSASDHQLRGAVEWVVGRPSQGAAQNPAMKTPARLQPLLDEGLIDEVLRQLMSGKEAKVYVVRCGDELLAAKVYKEAEQRSFRQAVDYTENRKVKNSRSARAMIKGSRYGREVQEAAWQNAEVDALHRLAGAGVRVPRPGRFLDGVLLMELVVDAEGRVAPRLNDMQFEEADALAHHATLIEEVVRMLGAGVVHGDLSEFNVLMAANGPVIIDLPQAVDAAGNNHAQRMLLRDVANLRDFFGRFAPTLLATSYGPEIWDLYSRGAPLQAAPLTGRFTPPQRTADVQGVLREIDDARAEDAARRLRIGLT